MSQLSSWGRANADLILLIVRAAFGLSCFAHGWGKVTGIDGFRGKWKLSLAMAWGVALVQTAGGLMLALGLLHGLAALALAICGAGITYKLIVDAKEPFMAPGQHSWDMGLMYTLLPLLLWATGPGRYALDATLR